MILKKWLSIPITVQSTTQQNWKQVNKQKALKIAPVNKKKIESFQMTDWDKQIKKAAETGIKIMWDWIT